LYNQLPAYAEKDCVEEQDGFFLAVVQRVELQEPMSLLSTHETVHDAGHLLGGGQFGAFIGVIHYHLNLITPHVTARRQPPQLEKLLAEYSVDPGQGLAQEEDRSLLHPTVLLFHLYHCRLARCLNPREGAG